MALFDSIINEVREKFDIGDKANNLLSVLLGMISDQENGGFHGFLASFDEVGLGDLASSWVNSSANMPISYEQTESVFSEPTLKEMSKETGIDYKTTISATAFMIPHIIDELTPNGEIPNERGLQTMLGSLSGIGAAKTISGIGTVAGNEAGHAVQSIGEDSSGNDENSIIRLLLPLILVGVLVAVGYMFCTKSSEKSPVMNVATNANVNTNRSVSKPETNLSTSNVKTIDASFSLRAENGKYFVSGIVPDAATEKQIKDALTAQYGAASLDFSGLRVDANAKSFGAGWWDNFSKLLPNLKGWTSGELSFAGNAITAASGLPQAAIDQIKTLFGAGWKLPVSIAGAENAAKQANAEALNELAEAKTVAQVVEALNVSIINFASGKSDIPADAKPILEKAAEVLKKQSAGTTVEIGGYTDNQGNSAANKTLSQSRADAVKKALVGLGVSDAMLRSVGYGDANPVGDNATEDGRFKNRRIEYKTGSGNAPTATTTSANANANVAK